MTKVAIEHYCRVWNDLRDTKTVLLRHFIVYGPQVRPNMAIKNPISGCLGDHPHIIHAMSVSGVAGMYTVSSASRVTVLLTVFVTATSVRGRGRWETRTHLPRFE